MLRILQNIRLLVLLYSCTAQVNDRYYPRYHLAPPFGWMNDPNGFSIFNNEYHLFYQFNPNTSLEPGIAHWGHAKSIDLFQWHHLPIAMYPDKVYDRDGVFSGSAIVEDNKMFLFYTGNINHLGKNPDHEQHQCFALSTDGINVTKYESNPVIEGTGYQPNIRDPKVWKHGKNYYMVLGNSLNNIGRAILFTSQDKINWQQASVLDQSDGSLGYMWECPDFFRLKNKFILIISPQGIPAQGDKFRNLYQTGYIIGDFDYNTNLFTPTSEFRELDHGHDFYATQTIEDNTGRRIILSWFNMWEQYYPERIDGFAGLITIPRTLTLSRDGRLLQKPVKEINFVRDKLMRSGKGDSGSSVTLPNKAGEVIIVGNKLENLEVVIEGKNAFVKLNYDYLNGTITLNRGGEDAKRRTKWRPQVKLRWLIYIDASSVELFCGDGEVTFSSRFFPDSEITVGIGEGCKAHDFTVHSLRRTVPAPKNLKIRQT